MNFATESQDELNPWAIIGLVASAIVILLLGTVIGVGISKLGTVCVVNEDSFATKTVICEQKVFNLVIAEEMKTVKDNLSNCELKLTRLSEVCLDNNPTTTKQALKPSTSTPVPPPTDPKTK